jgi:hypothetical protein
MCFSKNNHDLNVFRENVKVLLILIFKMEK